MTVECESSSCMHCGAPYDPNTHKAKGFAKCDACHEKHRKALSSTFSEGTWTRIGQDVLYTLHNGPRIDETRPAKIVRMEAGLRATLAVFTCGARDGIAYRDCPTVIDAFFDAEGSRGTWRRS